MNRNKKWNVTLEKLEGGKWVTTVIATYYSYDKAVAEATALRNHGYEAGICSAS